MKGRIVAMLLALYIPTTLLTGCGSQKAVDHFLDTLKKICELDDYHLELTVSADKEKKNGLRISGDVARSNYQAHLTVTVYAKESGDEGSFDVIVDGSNTYWKLGNWTSYVAKGYNSMKTYQEANELEEETLRDIAKNLGKKYVKVIASEKIFDWLNGSNHTEAASAFSEWYNGLRTELVKNVSEKNCTYTLSLKNATLQKQLLSLFQNLMDQEDVYRKALQPVLKSVEDVITESGWSDNDILDSIWSGYQDQNNALKKLKKEGSYNDWSFKMTDCERDSDGSYQVSANWNGDVDRYVDATIIPADQTTEISIPHGTINYSDQAENLAIVFMDTKNLLYIQNKNAEQTATEEVSESSGDTGDESTIDWNEWLEENKDDTKEYTAELELSNLDGYSHLKLTPMETEDGVEAKLPVVTTYSYCEAEYADNGNSNSIYLSNDGWEADIYTIDASNRSLKKILSDNVYTYFSTYKDDWDYKITQKESVIQKSSDGTACAAGFGYYDEDKGGEVTLICIAVKVKNSSYVMSYDFSIFSNTVKDNSCTSFQELCDYFSVKLPVTIAKK